MIGHIAIDMGMLVIYNQGIVKEICNALDIILDDGLFVRAYVNTTSNNLRIISGNHIFYNDYIKIEVVKILNKILNREI